MPPSHRGRTAQLTDERMGSLSIWHWVIILAFTVGVMVPLAKIFRRTGLSGW
jgi:hypothetical protein